MAKPKVNEARFDFRGGRVTSISPDLLNANELVDATNVRLTGTYGAFTKRSGCQRIHPDAFSAAINGVTQWDITSGKQVVVISGGDLYYRNGFDFGVPFTKISAAGVQRTTANQGAAAGWTGASNNLTGPVPTDTTVAAGSRIICKLGDPAIDNNIDAADDLYTFQFDVIADGTAISGTYASISSLVTVEISTDNGVSYPTTLGPYTAAASIGTSQTKRYSVTFTVAGSPAHVWVRLALRLVVTGTGTSGNGSGTVSVAAGGGNNYPATWSTGAARFSTSQPAIFAPFRASVSGSPLVLYIASGGHLFSWDGSATLTQLDPTNSAPPATAIISYHTRMFAMTANPATTGAAYPTENPKTIFWSKIGDATNFSTGDKTQGGSAVTDFLTGQHLAALEVIGSSLLMATIDSVMRFTGQSSDDIVISQNTEGISAEVGAVGLLALRRFENAAAMLAQRGPYGVTETSAVPIGEQVLPDFDALDMANIANSIVVYHRGRKELWFIVPGANDGGLNKTVFVQSVRLQSWYGPFTYSFGIGSIANYVGASGIENIIAGCNDGYVRLMDVGSKDDVLSNGSGGSNISMRVELPTLHFGDVGMTKALRQAKLQAALPSGHNLAITNTFDGGTADVGSFVDTTYDGTLRDYRVDMDGQGKRCKTVFTDSSAVSPTVYGILMQAYDLLRP